MNNPNKPLTLEEMIAEKAGAALQGLVAQTMEFIEEQKQFIGVCDEVAYPIAMIAEMTGYSAQGVALWFEKGELPDGKKIHNVAATGETRKAKFKEWKHYIGKKTKGAA